LVARDCEFSAAGTVYSELGYRLVWSSGSGADTAVPAVGEGEVLPVVAAKVTEHETQPPARFTEASLVAKMEELGIGRPSTYAATIAKLRDRSVFVRRGERALIPRVTALAVHRLLTLGFADLVDYGFTADMEERLDAIALGSATREDVLSAFWFGEGGAPGLSDFVGVALEEIEAREMVCLKVGVHPVSGDEIVVRPGKLFKGVGRPYVQCGERNLSIPEETPLADLGLDRVVRLLDSSWPRELGVHPDTGAPVTVSFGRFGGYVRCGDETRSLRSDGDLFDIDLDGALALLAEPKSEKRSGRRRV
jgi:DNA topoisomerase-1